MRITSGGNVGIGTVSPSRNQYGSIDPKLHVNTAGTSGAYDLVARFQAGPDDNNSGAAILINHTNDRGLLIEAGREISDTGIAHFGILNSGATKERILTLKQGGNVGIGTTSPARHLVLYGTAASTTSIQFQNADTGAAVGDGFGVGLDSAEKGFIWNYEGNDTYIGGAGGTSITVQNGGNVGIGTTSPDHQLDKWDSFSSCNIRKYSCRHAVFKSKNCRW